MRLSSTAFALSLFAASFVGCVDGRRDDDDTPEDDDDDVTAPDDDDDSADDDDSTPADDDDSTPTDDDDSTPADDDDSTVAPGAPTILEVDTCETQIVGAAYVRFSITVSDPDGDLLNPVRYRMQWRNIDTGISAALQQHEINQDMGSGGTITHLTAIGAGGVNRGASYEVSLWVLDSVLNVSPIWYEPYLVQTAANLDPC